MAIRRTELQVLVQALTAVQYEIQALSLGIRGPEDLHSNMRKLKVDAKTLMQSAKADADVLAFIEEGQRAARSG